jgi:predicted porin
MKKSLVALAVLAASGAAMAQSSVTLFGVVDAGYSVGNGSVSDSTAMRTDRIGSSRLGFRGVEDLGGGMRAEFWLEAGVANDSGAGSATNSNNQAVTGLASAGTQGLTFNRRSTVGLVTSMGELRLGRDYTPQFYPDAQYDPFGTNGVASSLIAFQGGVTGARASNMIAYHSPNLSGFTVMLGTWMGEINQVAGAAANKSGDGNGIHVRYAQGPLAVSYASSTLKSGATTETKTSTMGAAYDFKVARVMFNSNVVTNTGQKDLRGALVGVTVPMGGGTFKVSSALLEQDVASGGVVGALGTPVASTNRVAVGYVYPLSKRTSLFGTYARNTNSGGANRALNGAATAANGSSTGYDLGVNHTF